MNVLKIGYSWINEKYIDIAELNPKDTKLNRANKLITSAFNLEEKLPPEHELQNKNSINITLYYLLAQKEFKPNYGLKQPSLQEYFGLPVQVEQTLYDPQEGNFLAYYSPSSQRIVLSKNLTNAEVGIYGDARIKVPKHEGVHAIDEQVNSNYSCNITVYIENKADSVAGTG